LLRKLRGEAHGDEIVLARLDQRRRGAVEHHARTLDAALANVAKIGGLALGEARFANLRSCLPLTVPQSRESPRGHVALALAHMPALEVQRDAKSDRVIAVIGAGWAWDASDLGRPVTIAAVEDPALMQDNGLAHPMGTDIGDKFVEVRALDEGK